MTSLAASPTRSSKRAMYYVQSPSRDSYTSVTQPSTMMNSPTHDSSSLGRHSRNSSESRFSGISRSSSSDGKNVKKCRSNEKEYETILEEGSYEEMDDVTSIRRSQALLAVFIFIILFAVCCLITWGASRPYKAQISVQVLIIIVFISLKTFNIYIDIDHFFVSFENVWLVMVECDADIRTTQLLCWSRIRFLWHAYQVADFEWNIKNWYIQSCPNIWFSC